MRSSTSKKTESTLKTCMICINSKVSIWQNTGRALSPISTGLLCLMSDAYWRLVDLWLGYYRDCEAFDVSLGCPPSPFTPGAVIPVTRYQRARSARYAKERQRLLNWQVRD